MHEECIHFLVLVCRVYKNKGHLPVHLPYSPTRLHGAVGPDQYHAPVPGQTGLSAMPRPPSSLKNGP